ATTSGPRAPPSSWPFPYTTLFRSEIGARCVDIVQEQRAELRTRAQQPGQRAIAKQIWNFKKMPHRMQALQRQVVSVVGCLPGLRDRKSTRLNSSHSQISYAVFCLK